MGGCRSGSAATARVPAVVVPYPPNGTRLRRHSPHPRYAGRSHLLHVHEP